MRGSKTAGFLALLALTSACASRASDELFARADDAFFEAENMVEAEHLYREIAAHRDIGHEERARALRYANACVGRRGEIEKAIRLNGAWLREFPGNRRRHYTMFFQGIYLRRLGRETEARAVWQSILEEAPDSKIADSARGQLDNTGQRGSEQKPEDEPANRYKPGRILDSVPQAKNRYAVVRVALAAPDFIRVAEDIARFHDAVSIEWNGRDLKSLQAALKSSEAEHVAFVVEPRRMDINLHRQILMLSTELDEDIFPDFAFGYLTGTDGAALAQLWSRTKSLHANGLANQSWQSAAVASSLQSTRYEGQINQHASAAGFRGDSYYFGSVERDPETLSKASVTLRSIAKASVITMTGCGDPQGTWLFSDTRNRDRTKHWRYSPERVGFDPEGVMPRITADVFRSLPLQSSVIWSGVCHAGALERIYIEGDIVSTFGRVELATLHEQSAAQSVALALLDAGATAFLCPLGANHGWSVSREVQFALREGASLGATTKSTYDDVFLAARGALELGIQTHGERHREPEPVMQGGGANRILYGDPALRPFKATPDPREQIEIENVSNEGFDVLVTWEGETLHPRSWDIYGTDRRRDWAVYARICVDDLIPAGRHAISATVSARDDAGKALPYVMTHAEPEVFAGKRYIHLQANAARSVVRDKHVVARFKLRVDALQ